jgi:hypothetical protein
MSHYDATGFRFCNGRLISFVFTFADLVFATGVHQFLVLPWFSQQISTVYLML